MTTILVRREGELLWVSGASAQLATSLPYVRWRGSDLTTPVSTQALDVLRRWYGNSWLSLDPDTLVADDEEPPTLAPVRLMPGFRLETITANDAILTQLQELIGYWRNDDGTTRVGADAWASLVKLRDAGSLEDPRNVLQPYPVTVGVDFETGEFLVDGDSRAGEAFGRDFPADDVLARWQAKGLPVGFASGHAEEIYRSELARVGDGIQPDGLLAELYPYQRVSVAMAVERTGFAALHEPGLGKTICGIAWGLELLNRKQARRVVIIVPGAVRTQWEDEIRRFTGHDDIVVIRGDAKKRKAAYEAARDARWLIVHYDILSKDHEQLRPLITGQVLCADEAHRIKNPKSRRSQYLRQLARNATRRLALTGTPVENNPAEWYTLFHGFVQPGCLGAPQVFFPRYQVPLPWGGYEGSRNLDELHQRSKFLFVRYTKRDVAPHLPPLRTQLIRLDADEDYKAALKKAHMMAKDEIRAAQSGARGFNPEHTDVADMTAVTMLRLLCCSPRLVQASESPAAQALRDAGLIPDADGPKVEEVMLRAREWEYAGERAVVFTAFRAMATLIAERLDDEGIRYVSYTGADSQDARDAAVRAFVADRTPENPGPTVMVATDAAAEGLNLGRNCSIAVNLDVPWTPGRAEQRANRIHRVDSTHDSYLVVTMTVRGSIEDGLVMRLGAKANMADALLDEDHAAPLVGHRKQPVDTPDEVTGDAAATEPAGPTAVQGELGPFDSEPAGV
jgi:superfamily II DNA or RNA helicase